MIEDISAALRQHQEHDEVLGPLFSALHTFADRTIEEFYYDTPELPHPVVSMQPDRRDRNGYYTRLDGYGLVHRININPLCHRNGEEAAETLAHELVHLWQEYVGRPIQRNYHTPEFHARMALYGIVTEGKQGKHLRHEGRWPVWLEENADLDLASFALPGATQRPRRNLLKHLCPCGKTFRSRTPLAVTCDECGNPFEVK